MILYQVYPRSFFDANGDGVGDLKGLTAKLDYLASLGVEMIWVSPFFKSPMKDFGYDVSDYEAVDPLFGDMSDFDHLMTRARELDLKIMIDMVLSHTSDQHPWFTESRRSRDNDKSNWYVWADARLDGSPPNNWMSLFGGSAWQWDSRRGQYYLHNFLREQPDLNFHEPAVRKALLSACEFWLKKGVQGFRLDVCNFYYHSESLRNNPARGSDEPKTDGVQAANPYNFQKHVFDKDQVENLQFLNDFRALTDRYPGTILMGEVVSDDSLGVMSQYIAGGGPLHTAYNFSLFRSPFDGNALAAILLDVEERLPSGQPSWALGNHDVPRFSTRWRRAANEPLDKTLKCDLFLLMCLRGNVIVYQGDELGLEEAEIAFELMQDPFGIEFYPDFKGRDGCRTPMPWSSQRLNQATAPKPWLPIPDEHLEKSVEAQLKSAVSHLSWVKKLLAWRRKNLWLNEAPLRVLASTEQSIVLSREHQSFRFIAAINRSGEVQELELNAVGRTRVEPYAFRAWLVDENKKAVEAATELFD